MKKRIVAFIAVALVLTMVACSLDDMTIDELIKKSGLKKIVTPTYTGKAEWEAAGCILPTVTYKGVDGTAYDESSSAPTEAGKYVAVFTIIDPNTSVPTAVEASFEL